MVTEADLSLFQGQKGDPGLSPEQAHNGAKVGFRNPSTLLSPGALQERLHEPGSPEKQKSFGVFLKGLGPSQH